MRKCAVMLDTIIVITHYDLSDLDTGLDAAFYTDFMVVGKNESLIIVSRITWGTLKLCIY